MDLTSTHQQQDPAQHSIAFITSAQLLSDKFTHLAPEKTCITLADMGQLAFLLITEPLPAPFQLILSEKEQTQLSTFTFEKRYKEWLGGRLATKLCLKKLKQQFNIPKRPLQALSITADDNGRPCITPAIPEPVDISISHSHQYVTAIASLDIKVGIDIQRISPRIAKVAERFTSSEENGLFHNAKNLLHCLTIIWASKEAVKKQILHDQPTIFSGITIKSALSQSRKRWTNTCEVNHKGQKKEIFVEVDMLDDYVLAVTRGENHA